MPSAADGNSEVPPGVAILRKVQAMLGLGLDLDRAWFPRSLFSCLSYKVLPVKGLEEEKCPGLCRGNCFIRYN